MRNIKFAWKYLCSAKFLNFLFLIEMTVTMLLFSSSYDVINRYNQSIQRFKYMSEHKGYVNGDTTSESHLDELLSHEKQSLKKSLILYHYIKNNKHIRSYSLYSYDNSSQEYNYNKEYYTEDLFFTTLGLSAYQGTIHINQKYKTTIPIVVGYDLRNHYQYNHVYTISLTTKKNVHVIVKGILENQTTIPSINSIGETESLDHAIILPIVKDFSSDFANVDMLINSTVVFTKDPHELRKIEYLSSQLDLFSMKYHSINANIKSYGSFITEKLRVRFMAMIIILFFSIFSMILNILTMISRMSRDFSIHIMLGATKRDIVIQIVLQVFFLMIPGTLLVIGLNGFTLTTLLSLLLALLILTCVVITPIHRIQKMDVITIYHTEE